MKGTKFVLNFLSVICFIYGSLYIFTLVFIPIAVYCFIAGKNFSRKAENLNDTFTFSNKAFKGYTIFVSIFCFPFGLLAIIPYVKLVSNNVKVNDVETLKVEFDDGESAEATSNGAAQNDSYKVADDADKKESKVANSQNLSESEKREQYEKLVNFNKKGLITDEELKQAKEQLFGEDEK